MGKIQEYSILYCSFFAQEVSRLRKLQDPQQYKNNLSFLVLDLRGKDFVHPRYKWWNLKSITLGKKGHSLMNKTFFYQTHSFKWFTFVPLFQRWFLDYQDTLRSLINDSKGDFLSHFLFWGVKSCRILLKSIKRGIFVRHRSRTFMQKSIFWCNQSLFKQTQEKINPNMRQLQRRVASQVRVETPCLQSDSRLKLNRKSNHVTKCAEHRKLIEPNSVRFEIWLRPHLPLCSTSSSACK